MPLVSLAEANTAIVCWKKRMVTHHLPLHWRSRPASRFHRGEGGRHSDNREKPDDRVGGDSSTRSLQQAERLVSLGTHGRQETLDFGRQVAEYELDLGRRGDGMEQTDEEVRSLLR